MGVDWYACEVCGETFPDCGDYVYCYGCGRKWCSDECANNDGFIENKDECSCDYCRGDKFEDDELLEFALDQLKKTRDELVKEFKKSRT